MAGVKKANSNLLYVYHMDKTSLSDAENLFLNGDSKCSPEKNCCAGQSVSALDANGGVRLQVPAYGPSALFQSEHLALPQPPLPLTEERATLLTKSRSSSITPRTAGT